jgi:hypothetical protein
MCHLTGQTFDFCFYVGSLCQPPSTRSSSHNSDKGKEILKFGLFWLEGSLLIVCLKRSYQLLSVLTRIGQAPNTVCAK